MSKLADKNSFTQQKGTTQSNPSSAADLECSDLHGLHLAADLHGGAAAIQTFKQETMGRSIRHTREGHVRWILRQGLQRRQRESSTEERERLKEEEAATGCVGKDPRWCRLLASPELRSGTGGGIRGVGTLQRREKRGGGRVRHDLLFLVSAPLFCSSQHRCLCPVFIRPRGSSGKTGSVRRGGHPGGGGRRQEVLVVGDSSAGYWWWAAPRRRASLGLLGAGQGGVVARWGWR